MENETVRAKRDERAVIKQRELLVKRQRDLAIKHIVANDPKNIIRDLNFSDEFDMLKKMKNRVVRTKLDSAAIVI